MTKSIQRLEHELGVALFHRRPRGIVLTSAGSAFLTRVKAATQEIRRGEEEVALLAGGSEGTLSFGISSASSLMLAPEVISRFVSNNPSIQVRIIGGVYSTVLPQLREGLLEFSIGPRPQADIDDAFEIHELFRSDRVIVGRKGHPLAKSTSLKQLVGADWLITGMTGLDLSSHIAMFQRHGLPVPAVRVQCDSLSTYLPLVSSSDLLMMLPRLWLESPMASDSLVAIPLKEALPSADICVVQRKGLGLTPIAERFLTEVRRAAEFYMRSQ